MMQRSSAVLAFYIAIFGICIVTYLKADHFTVGPKGDTIVRADTGENRKDSTSSNYNNHFNQEEEDLLSDPTSFFGSSTPRPPLPPQKQKSQRSTKGGVQAQQEEERKREKQEKEEQEEEEEKRFKEDEDKKYREGEKNKEYDDRSSPPIENNGQGGIFSMTSLSATSAFYLTKTGQLMERFYNGYKWVYHSHLSPSHESGALTSLSSVRLVEDRDTTLFYIGYVYASDVEGRMYRATSRRYFNNVLGNGTGDFSLEWSDISWEDYRVFTGGILSGKTNPRRIYFADADGRLLERTIESVNIVEKKQLYRALYGLKKTIEKYGDYGELVEVNDENNRKKGGMNDDEETMVGVGEMDDFEELDNDEEDYGEALDLQQNRLWKSRGSPNGNGIALVGAAMSVHPFSIFCITIEGDLAEWRHDGKWAVHKRPSRSTRLAMLPMTLVRQTKVRNDDSTTQTDIAMLLTSEDGAVWARMGTQDKYRWERQRRAPAKVASAPSNAIILPHTVSIFFVGIDGSLMERRYRMSSSRWLWTDYGHPPNLPLTTARPVAMSVSNVLCQAVDGSTASLTKWNGKWQWIVHSGPELFVDDSVDGGEEADVGGIAMEHHAERYDDTGGPVLMKPPRWNTHFQHRFVYRVDRTGMLHIKGSGPIPEAAEGNDEAVGRMELTDGGDDGGDDGVDDGGDFNSEEEENEGDEENIIQEREYLCTFDPNHLNTCGIRRHPQSYLQIPSHMFTQDTFQSIGVNYIAMPPPKNLKVAVLHNYLIMYIDKEQHVNFMYVKPVTDMASLNLNKADLPPEVENALKYGVVPSNIHHDIKSPFIERASSKWILPKPINTTLTSLGGKYPVPMLSSYFMGELLATSVFSLSPSGTVFERFFNGIKWVYVRHENPGSRRLISVTTVASHGTIFVADERGQLFQRISPGLDRPLAWKRVLIGHSVAAGGVTGKEIGKGVCVFFVNQKNDIIAYSVHRRNWTNYIGNGDEMIDCESNAGELFTISSTDSSTDTSDEKIGDVWGSDGDSGVEEETDGYDNEEVEETASPKVIIDAFNLLEGSLFVIDVHGQLLEHAKSERLWINHGTPERDVPLSYARGVVLRDSHPNRVGSIFLRRSDGTLTERWWDATVGGWRWMHHGSPNDTYVASAPGALHEARELYVVCGDGNLWSRAYLESASGGEWKWVLRGAPSSPLSLVAPIKVGGGEVMVVTLDGKLATIKADSRIDFREVGWQMFESPEAFSKGSPPLHMYCSDDPLSPYNCIQGNDESVVNKKKIDTATTLGTVRLAKLELANFGIRLRMYDFDEKNQFNAFYTNSRKRKKREINKKLFNFDKASKKHRLPGIYVNGQQGSGGWLDIFYVADVAFWWSITGIICSVICSLFMFGHMPFMPSLTTGKLKEMIGLSSNERKKKFPFIKRVKRSSH